MLPQEIKNIEQILVSFLGESKCGMSDEGQMQFPCPRCIEEKGDIEASKYNLEVNLYKMQYQCWSCSTTDDDMKGPISRLIKQYGSPNHLTRYLEEIESLKSSRMYDPDIFSGITIDDIEREVIKLPVTFKKLNLDTCDYQLVKDYCGMRSITQDVINKFNIGYTDYTEKAYGWKNRLIIPSYDMFGELNYYVGRDMSGKSKMKYKNCSVRKTDIIFQESLINWDADIVLVEGAIDCLRYPNTISLLGKKLDKSSYLTKVLHTRSNGEIVVALDGDTRWEETEALCKTLYTNSIKKRLRFIMMSDVSPYKDFSEAVEYGGKRALMDIMRKSKRYTEQESDLERLKRKII